MQRTILRCSCVPGADQAARRRSRTVDSSMNYAPWSIAGVLALASMSASAGDELYRVNSRAVGWDSIDLTITETRREGRVSHVTIPRYSDRTSVESRFAMCAFTDMALQRKFAVWVVSEVGDDKVLVGFLTSDNEDIVATLGPRFASPNLLKASVRAVNRMCGITVK